MSVEICYTPRRVECYECGLLCFISCWLNGHLYNNCLYIIVRLVFVPMQRKEAEYRRLPSLV